MYLQTGPKVIRLPSKHKMIKGKEKISETHLVLLIRQQRRRKNTQLKNLNICRHSEPNEEDKKELYFKLFLILLCRFIRPVNKCYRDFLAIHPPLRQHQFDWLDVMIFKTIQKCRLY
jgi:hypothetical protein